MTVLTFSLLVCCAGCSPETGNAALVDAGEVVTLEVCPSGTCSPVADGITPTTVSVCTPVASNRTPGLTAMLQLSAGTWLGGGASTTVPLSAQRCATPSFVTTQPGNIRVDATVAGFQAFTFVTLQGAPLASLEMTPSPPLLMPAATSIITLNVAARSTPAGHPSIGTLLQFAFDPPVPGGTIFPASAILSPATDNAMATVVVPPMSPTATIRVTATPPQIKGANAPAPAPVTQPIQLFGPNGLPANSDGGMK